MRSPAPSTVTLVWAPAKASAALNWMGMALRMLTSCAKTAKPDAVTSTWYEFGGILPNRNAPSVPVTVACYRIVDGHLGLAHGGTGRIDHASFNSAGVS